jgi:hypothetical protein
MSLKITFDGAGDVTIGETQLRAFFHSKGLPASRLVFLPEGGNSKIAIATFTDHKAPRKLDQLQSTSHSIEKMPMSLDSSFLGFTTLVHPENPAVE